MARALTTKFVENVKPDPSKRVEIPDPALSGLYLVIQPTGAKSWALRYRHRGKPKKLTLGRWPVMGVAAAREAATEALNKVDQGSDPSAEKKALKARGAELAERDTIRALVDLHDKRHLSKLKSGHVVRRELNRHFVARFGDVDIHDITKRDLVDLLDGIADSGRETTANRLRGYLSKFFVWCVERDVIEANPMQGVKRPAKEKSRDRVLSDDEIRWFWNACEAVGWPWGGIGRVLLLTGQRLGEVLGMRDTELDGAIWTLPGDRTKNGRVHTVPLSDAVATLIDEQPRVGRTGLVFTRDGVSQVADNDAGVNALRAAMAAQAEAEGRTVEHWTFHDLRRTAATGMARLGIPVRVTEAVLNHVSGTGGGIVAVYQRHDYADEKARALEAWARFVADLVEGRETDNIVTLEIAR